MRWQALFDDLEAQLAAAEAAELAAEVSERSRLETGRVRLFDRCAASRGHPLVLTVLGAGRQRGTLLDVGVDWLLLDEAAGRELLVPLPALLAVSGLGPRSEVPGAEGEVTRRLDYRWALRGLVRARAAVTLTLVDGGGLAGTLDRVGADHVDLAEHLPGEPRRTPSVRSVRTIALSAVALVRRG